MTVANTPSPKVPVLIPGASPRVQAWARTAGVTRAQDRFSAEDVERWAAKEGLSQTATLIDVEEALGGLFSSQSSGDVVKRPLVVLGFEWVAGRDPSLVASWKNASPETDPMTLSCGVEEPTIRKYPRWSFADIDLILVGEWRGRLVFCDPEGAIYLLHGEAGTFDVIAGTPRVALEQIAIEEELWSAIGHFVTVRILGDCGAVIADALSLPLTPEASDNLVRTYEGPSILVRQRRARGPTQEEAQIVTSDPARACEAALAARASFPAAKIKVHPRTEEARAHIQALVAAGLGDEWSLTSTPMEEAMSADNEDPDESDPQ